MHVDLDYETLRRELPAHVEPAYDGMVDRAAGVIDGVCADARFGSIIYLMRITSVR